MRCTIFEPSTVRVTSSTTLAGPRSRMRTVGLAAQASGGLLTVSHKISHAGQRNEGLSNNSRRAGAFSSSVAASLSKIDATSPLASSFTR